MKIRSNNLYDKAILLDVDRTIFNTDVFVDNVYEYAGKRAGREETRVTLRRIQKEEYAARGTSYDLIRELEAHDLMPTFEELSRQSHRFVYDGVNKLLSYVESRHVPVVLLTYGHSRAQQLKIALLCHHLARSLAFRITGVASKALWLESSIINSRISVPLDDGATLHAHKVLLLDDKQVNIASTNSHICGILIANDVVAGKNTSEAFSIAEVLPAVRAFLEE